MLKATAQPPQPVARGARWAVFLLALPPFAFALWMAGWTGVDAKGNPLPGAHTDFLWALTFGLPLAAAWLASAWGFGWIASRWLVKPLLPTFNTPPLDMARDRVVIEVGLGVAVMLFLNITAGSLGLMQFLGSGGAWIILIAGLALLVARAALVETNPYAERSNWFALAWLAATPAVGVLLLAACSAPSWLWHTEFGGYDALSYHLQLPREWIADGRIHGVTHNVYSFMPSYMESAYYHLAVLTGDGIHAAYACQLLHAGITILAAWVTARVAFRFAGKTAGCCAFIAVLGTPWTIVAGSLAYNEMTVVLLLATAVLVLEDFLLSSVSRAAIVGLLVGVACGAKLTAIGFVAAPIAVLACFALSHRRFLLAVLAGVAGFVLALAPWPLRNVLETGNPVFPFLTDFFGTGHFTAEQVEIWSNGHKHHGNLGSRFAALWHQFGRYGIGPNPEPHEPWIAQWSVLPWLGVMGLCLALTRLKTTLWAMHLAILFVLQLAFWLVFTHLKSRFLLPAVVPLSLGVGLGAAAISTFIESRISRVTNVARAALTFLGFLVAIAWCAQPVAVFAREPSPGHPAPAARVGRIDLLTGEAFSAHDRAQLAGVSHVIAINELPADSHTLLIGEATPFYITSNFTYQTTWDRGPMSTVMRGHPDDPARWIGELRAHGFTHLFINESMLERWEAAGWNDPLITAERVTSAAEAHARRVQVTPTGTLYRLPK